MAARILGLTLTVTLTLMSAAPVSAESTDGPQEWMTDYGRARELSRNLGLPLIVHFHASWCGPCLKMERETLSSPELKRLLGSRILGIKVDSDRHPGLLTALRVDALPSDVIIGPDNRIVATKSGYQSKRGYLTMAAHWSSQFGKHRAEAIARLTPKQPASDAEVQAQRPRPRINEPAVTKGKNGPTDSVIPPLIALDGFSPVQIKTRRRWVKGKPDFAITWQGVVYYLVDENEYRQFLNSPQQFAPRMLGCDPVKLYQADRAVQGSVEWGAFFNDELYLFVDAESRNQFKIAPHRYAGIRHALRSDEVQGTRLR